MIDVKFFKLRASNELFNVGLVELSICYWFDYFNRTILFQNLIHTLRDGIEHPAASSLWRLYYVTSCKA